MNGDPISDLIRVPICEPTAVPSVIRYVVWSVYGSWSNQTDLSLYISFATRNIQGFYNPIQNPMKFSWEHMLSEQGYILDNNLPRLLSSKPRSGLMKRVAKKT